MFNSKACSLISREDLGKGKVLQFIFSYMHLERESKIHKKGADFQDLSILHPEQFLKIIETK